MAIETIEKIYKTSNTGEGINVPMKIRKLLGYKKGDYIKITWGEIVKSEDSQDSQETVKKENIQEKNVPEEKVEEDTTNLPQI